MGRTIASEVMCGRYKFSTPGEPDADTLELVPVSTAVNSVKNDGPECAERVG